VANALLVVNHKQTARQELTGGYLWSPVTADAQDVPRRRLRIIDDLPLFNLLLSPQSRLRRQGDVA
jgi:hypothetical protein